MGGTLAIRCLDNVARCVTLSLPPTSLVDEDMGTFLRFRTMTARERKLVAQLKTPFNKVKHSKTQSSNTAGSLYKPTHRQTRVELLRPWKTITSSCQNLPTSRQHPHKNVASPRQSDSRGIQSSQRCFIGVWLKLAGFSVNCAENQQRRSLT